MTVTALERKLVRTTLYSLDEVRATLELVKDDVLAEQLINVCAPLELNPAWVAYQIKRIGKQLDQERLPSGVLGFLDGH